MTGKRLSYQSALYTTAY